MSTPALDHLICGYCRAPIAGHDLLSLKLCNHRLTAEAAATRSDAIQEAIEVVKAENPTLTFGSANGGMMKKCIIAALEQLKTKGSD